MISRFTALVSLDLVPSGGQPTIPAKQRLFTAVGGFQTLPSFRLARTTLSSRWRIPLSDVVVSLAPLHHLPQLTLPYVSNINIFSNTTFLVIPLPHLSLPTLYLVPTQCIALLAPALTHLDLALGAAGLSCALPVDQHKLVLITATVNVILTCLSATLPSLSHLILRSDGSLASVGLECPVDLNHGHPTLRLLKLHHPSLYGSAHTIVTFASRLPQLLDLSFTVKDTTLANYAANT